MSRVKTETVALADLQLNLFVRKALNVEHALHLAELLENGVKLPPIKITQDRMVIDGRHRIEAHHVALRKEIEAEVEDVKDETSLIVEAYKANVGGPLPPSRDDTEHTVMMLLEHGEAKKRIAALLGLPAGMACRYVNEVQSKATRAKLQRAAAAVTDGGLTVAKAAEQYDADPEKVKELLSGRRRKQQKEGIAEIRRNFTKLYQSVGLKNASAIRRLLDKHEDGDVTEKQVSDIFSHIEHLQKESARKVADWRKRFEAMNGKPAKSE